MDYHDFEDHVHAIILERGKDYFDRGLVSEIEQTAEGWTMSIQGQTRYSVVLRGRTHLEDWFCECPHAHGPVCKHVAAALFAVRHTREQGIKQVLDQMSDKELRAFIRNQSNILPALHSAILGRRAGSAEEE